MIDLNSTRSLSDRVTYLLDRVESTEDRRRYLGASVIGHACERHVQYQYLSAIGEIDAPTFSARIRRIFQRGHIFEGVVKQWLGEAGIVIEEGPSFRDDDLGMGGHTDGVVATAPEHLGIQTPCLWECKVLKDSSFKSLKKGGLKSFSATYYGQIQTYMTATGVIAPALYTALNADTMEIFCFLVEFDAHHAVGLHNRVEHVVNVTRMGELVPRMTTDPAHYQCKMCPFSGRCW